MSNVKKNIPNFLTLIGMAFGVLAIILASSSSYPYLLVPPCLLIFASVLTDQFDGRLARKFSCESALGKQLDSLSDLVCFGVAPALIVWRYAFFILQPNTLISSLGLISTIFMTLCGAYRLARYNVSGTQDSFTGIPIPVGGGSIVIFVLLSIYLNHNGHYTHIIPIFFTVLCFLVGILMVSRMKVVKL